MTPFPRLYAIADAAFGDPVRIALALFDAGVRLVQLRDKGAASGRLLDQARRIVAAAPAGASLIVNDRADVALLAGAAGVHVGQDDLPAAHARRIVGDGKLVGVSTHDLEQAASAASEPVDYLAVGPVFKTSTKADAAPVVGVEGLARICEAVDRPVAAIGGVTLDALGEVFDAGAASAAVVSDLLGRGDVRRRAEAFLARLRALGVA